MSEAEKRRLTASKKHCKTAVTRLEKYLELGSFECVQHLQVRKISLQETLTRYRDIVVSLEVMGMVEEDDDTEERALEALVKIEVGLAQFAQKTMQSQDMKLANLPSLEIPVFDGRDVASYKPFIEMFEAVVHADTRIPVIQKLCFLKKYLRGEPLHIIDNLPIVSSSYSSALELLKNRYDNPALIINNHVNILLDIPALNRGTAQQIRDLVAKVRQQTTALRNLKQPVDSWDAILSCVLLRKLDSYTVRLYHSERDNTMCHTVSSLLSFLERRAVVMESSPTSSDNSYNKVKVVAHSVSNPTSNECILCSQQHRLYKCPKLSSMSPTIRLEYVLKHGLCKICLGKHANHKCRYHFKCTMCSSKTHNSLIHVPQCEQAENRAEGSEPANVNLHARQSVHNVLLPTAKVLVTDCHNNKHVVRALLDCGSQTSFCTTALATKLGLPQFNSNKTISTLGDSNSKLSKGIQLTVHSMVQDFKVNVTCSIINTITTKLPQHTVNFNKFTLPNSITLADDEFNVPGDVSLLLAADIFCRIIQDGKVEASPGDLVLLNTRFGYVVSGSISVSPFCNYNAVTMHTAVHDDLNSCVQQFWEAEKVPEVYLESVPEHVYSEQVFQESTSLINKHFEVKYPLKIDLHDVDPSNSFAIALQRLYNLEKRFSRDTEFHDLYKNFIHEYLKLGHAKVVNLKPCEPIHEPIFFLPHHAVLRPDKNTNKLRTVFDGSAKTKAGHCLNDVLCNGPVVQNSLFDILMLYRTFKYTVQCDIQHMYRMISVHPDHRRLQNILWREHGVLQCLQLQTVTYGLKSSAYLATRCLVELAKRYKSDYPLASEAVLKCSYVDDVQGGSDTLQGAIQLKDELIALAQLGGFKLHKWISNNSQVLEGIASDKLGFANRDISHDDTAAKILGLSYDARDDTFRMSGKVLTAPNVPTKRNVLSSISRLYDPMGFAGPITVKAKLILQQVWQYNLDWDDSLPVELVAIWNSFYNNLVNMPTMYIPRYIQLAEASDVQIVGYCDASADAYGCCLYLKVTVGDKTYIHLLCSKSRVAPLASKLTIPKLELNGALLLSKLASHVAKMLNISNIYLFCDSKIVLAWLDSSALKLPAYIGNRVKEIYKLTESMTWKYTPGLLNPADILSRGAEPQEVINCKLWHHGPDYLIESNVYNFYLSEVEHPMDTSCYDEECNTCNTYLSSIVNVDGIDLFFKKYSNLFKMVRITVYMLRFFYNCKNPNNRKTGLISVLECRDALFSIIKGVQSYHFINEFNCLKKGKPVTSNLKALNPFIDSTGILRVGSRLSNATELSYSKKFNIILPKHCHVTKLIITQEHLMLKHGGLKLTLGNLCEKYCIINSVREVKSVINKCIVCHRYKAVVAQQLMGSLPKERVTPARVFENVGLDYCGPFDIRQSTLRRSVVSKGYVAVFVCFASKAVSMEVVSDMTTDTFIAALKRFISRRGSPSNIYCDNASTFRGANNKLKQLYDLHKTESFQTTVNDQLLQKNIQFNFIPKYSPNHGGLWEAAIKGAKYHFKRIASNRTFTYEQFNTIITEIEAILNSRPLTPLSQDPSDFSYLTPGHFIIGTSMTSTPQPDLDAVPASRLRFWRSCEQVRQHFWKAWSKQYLCILHQRTKWQREFPNLKVGMVVLLKAINTPPLSWPLGRISKVFYGNDNKVRVVEVQTSDKKLHSRSISKIVVLPTED